MKLVRKIAVILETIPIVSDFIEELGKVISDKRKHQRLYEMFGDTYINSDSNDAASKSKP